MKKKFWVPVVALAMATALLVSLSVFVSAGRQAVWGHTEGLIGEEILERLYALNAADFKEDVDEALQNGQGSEWLVCWIGAASKRVSDYSDDELLQRIVENQADAFMGQLWVDLYGIKYPDRDHNDPRLLALLQDPEVSPGLKISILVSVGFESEEEISVLKDLCQDPDAALQFNAMNRLYKVDEQAALAMAQQATRGNDRSGGNKMQGSIAKNCRNRRNPCGKRRADCPLQGAFVFGNRSAGKGFHCV